MAKLSYMYLAYVLQMWGQWQTVAAGIKCRSSRLMDKQIERNPTPAPPMPHTADYEEMLPIYLSHKEVQITYLLADLRSNDT